MKEVELSFLEMMIDDPILRKTDVELLLNILINYPEYHKYEPFLLKLSEENFSYFVFYSIFEAKVLETLLSEITDITDHYNTTLTYIKNKFPNTKFIIDSTNNQMFLQSLENATVKLFNLAKKNSFYTEKNLFQFCFDTISDYLDDKEIKTLVNFVDSDTSYTSYGFMKKHTDVVGELSQIKMGNNVYAYKFDNHWYLLIQKNSYSIDVFETRSNTWKYKNKFIESHKGVYINYVELGIQEKIESLLGVEGICGKICIAIHDFFRYEQDKNIHKIKTLLKTDLEYSETFVAKIICLIHNDGPTSYHNVGYDIKPFIENMEFDKNQLAEIMNGEDSGLFSCCNIL